MLCHSCYKNMIEVIIAKMGHKEHRAFVCAECGKIVSKDSMFRKVA